MTIRVLRYLVQFRGSPNVGYHSSLGKAAKDWAVWTARTYRGRLICELTDGTQEVCGDWSWHVSQSDTETEPGSVSA